MKFIIWDPKDGEPRRSEIDGSIISSGCTGPIGPDNCYLTTYAQKRKGQARAFTDLDVGERIEVTYSLGGSRGDYLVIRVE